MLEKNKKDPGMHINLIMLKEGSSAAAMFEISEFVMMMLFCILHPVLPAA